MVSMGMVSGMIISSLVCNTFVYAASDIPASNSLEYRNEGEKLDTDEKLKYEEASKVVTGSAITTDTTQEEPIGDSENNKNSNSDINKLPESNQDATDDKTISSDTNKSSEVVQDSNTETQEKKVTAQPRDITSNSYLNDWEYEIDSAVSGGAIVLKKYTGSSKDITIPGELDGQQVILAVENRPYLQNISNIIPDDITSLTIKQVNGKKVKLGNSDYLGRAFRNFSKLKSADLKGLDVSNVTNIEYMFYGCSSLEQIDVSNWDVSQVTNMSAVFDGCSSLKQIDVSGWDVSQVTKIGFMFYGCSSLEQIDVSNWDVSQVTEMSAVFDKCSSLKQIDVSGWDVSQVTNMSYMFYGCSSLEQIDVSNWDVSQVTNISYMFYGCSSLKQIDVSNWDVSQVDTMYGMFYGCSSLEQIDVSNWDISQVTSMGRMFYGCSNLEQIDMSAWNIAQNTSMGEMFYSDYPSPLLIITRDKRLKNYNYKQEHRLPFTAMFEANGGSFSDGTSTSSVEVFVLEELSEQAVDAVLNQVEIPTRDNHRFTGWLTNKNATLKSSSPTKEDLLNRLSATYYAQWETDSTPILEFPTIHADDVTLTVGDTFEPLKNVTAFDKLDGELKDIQVILNEVNTDKAGKYIVTYQVENSKKLVATKSIIVTVKEADNNSGSEDNSGSGDNSSSGDNGNSNNIINNENTNIHKNTNSVRKDKSYLSKIVVPKTSDTTDLSNLTIRLVFSGVIIFLLGRKRRKNRLRVKK